MDPTKFNFDKQNKRFCDASATGHQEGAIFLAFVSGEDIQTVAFTPKHAKEFCQSLFYAIEKYEGTFGPINVQWMPGIKSPIDVKPQGPKDQKK